MTTAARVICAVLLLIAMGGPAAWAQSERRNWPSLGVVPVQPPEMLRRDFGRQPAAGAGHMTPYIFVPDAPALVFPDGGLGGSLENQPAQPGSRGSRGSVSPSIVHPEPRIVGDQALPAFGNIETVEKIDVATGQRLQTIGPETAAPLLPYNLAVGIKYKKRGSREELICTGTLIDGQHVLTAGHCGCGIPDSYEIVIDDDLNQQQAIKRSLSVPPALFDARVCNTGRLYGTDLALLTLKVPVACPIAAGTPANLRNGNAAASGQGAQLRSDCRPAYAQNGPGKTFGYPDVLAAKLTDVLLKGAKLTAIGYGYNEKHEIGRRAWAQIPIVTPNCTERPWSRTCAPFAEIVLAHAPGGKARSDTCNGDSGGPIFLINETGYTLIGVTSRAAPGISDDPELHCGGGGIYTLIGRQSVQAWLSAHGVQASRPLAARSAAKPN